MSRVLEPAALSRSRLRFRRLRDYVRAILNTVRDPLIVIDENLRVKTVNRSFCTTFQVSPRETQDRSLDVLGNGQWNIPGLKGLLQEILTQGTRIQGFEVDRTFPNIGRRMMLLHACRIQLAGKSRPLILLSVEDITQRKGAERALEKLNGVLKSQSITDDLTGLYNRRGFSVVSQHYVELAQRKRKHIFVVFADVDGLKMINDQQGHLEGDRTLVRAAEILRETFRKSDIIARIGGDEFAIVTMENGHDDVAIQMARLQENLKRNAATNGHHEPISFSTGVACSDPHEASTLDALIAQADALMYIEKRFKHRSDIALPERMACVA
jgi:diguanylate cyclase (GGDEF)-like protein/PAS domain S-box-containing protein